MYNTPHFLNPGQPAQPVQQNFFDTSSMGDVGAMGNVAISFNVEIVALNLQETGTYNDHYTRSYKANMIHDNLNDIMSTVARSNMVSGAGVFGSLASNIIDIDSRVSASDMINIPNGWATRRFRFLLQIRETSLRFPGTVYFTYIQGFTESQDITLQTKTINPNMRFFINNFIRIAENTINTPNGPKLSQRVIKSGQVVNGALVVDQTGMLPTVYMRPSDVLGKIQTDQDSELRSGDVLDIRNTNIGGSNSVFNHFNNNTASSYLSRLVTPMVESVKTIGFGPGNSNRADVAASNSIGAEPQYDDSPFMTMLMRRANMVGAATFSMNELAAIDPSVGTRTTLKPVAQEWAQALPSRGNSEVWDSATAETVFATKLVNAIPGFMWQSYIGFVSFSMTNRLMAGRVELKLQNLIPVTNFAPPQYVQAFLTDMEEMIARDISYNGQLMFDVFVNASIIGDIQLQVSINGGPSVPYTAPAFGSGVLNPVYTHDQGSFNKLANGMRTVMDGLQTIYQESSDFSSGGTLNPNI